MEMDKYRTPAIFLLIVLCFLVSVDIILTTDSVILRQIAVEQNVYILFLWNHFGYFYGTVIETLIDGFILTFLSFGIVSKNEYYAVISAMTIFCGIIIWIPAVVSNLLILIKAF